MKKFVILLLIAFIVTGCDKSKNWDDVKPTFDDAKKQVDENVSLQDDVINQAEYEKLIDDINKTLDEVKFSQDDDNTQKLIKMYKAAEYIGLFMSLFDGNCAQQLLSMSTGINDLVQAIYNGDKDKFNEIKGGIQTVIDDTKTWTSAEWSTIEKKNKVLWDNVAEQIEKISDDINNKLTDFNELTENELDELKHVIIDNYELIKNGINEDTDKIAQEIYEAASKLEAYVGNLTHEQADKVRNFAKNAKSYVKQCYGKVLDESEQLKNDFDNDVENAKKWTLSTWNQIVTQLRIGH